MDTHYAHCLPDNSPPEHTNFFFKPHSHTAISPANSEWRTLSDLEAVLPLPLRQFLIIAIQHVSSALRVPGRALVGLSTRFPQATKHPARVEHGQSRDGDDDHRAFKDHEGGLVVGNLAREAALELGDTVDGADVDRDGCEGDGCVLCVSRVLCSSFASLAEHIKMKLPKRQDSSYPFVET